MVTSGDKKTILIVEDEMDMRFFLVTLLEVNGYTAITAKNGREGIQKAGLLHPALILLDVMMPEQGGIIMYRELKSKPELSRIPVIMLSAIQQRSFSHSLCMLNANRAKALPPPHAYLEKPPDPERVLHTIRQFI